MSLFILGKDGLTPAPTFQVIVVMSTKKLNTPKHLFGPELKPILGRKNLPMQSQESLFCADTEKLEHRPWTSA